MHVLDCPRGRLEITCSATLAGEAAEVHEEPLDRAAYLRPSRYAESDRLAAEAAAELGGLRGQADLLAGVSSWVGDRLDHVPGRVGPCGPHPRGQSVITILP